LEIGVKRNGALWGEPTNQNWNQTLTERQILDYLSSATDTIQNAQENERTCRGSIWTGAIRQGMPTAFDNLPMELITSLYEVPIMAQAPQFSELIQSVVENSLTQWIKTVEKPDKLEIPPSVQGIIDKFSAMGMSNVGADITVKFLAGVEGPKSIDSLVEELDNSTSLEGAISMDNLRSRWKRAVKDKSFVVELDNLMEIGVDSLETLDEKTVEDLFGKSLVNTLQQVSGGDHKAIQSICGTIVSLMDTNEYWKKIVIGRDGFIGAKCDEKMRQGGDIILSGKAVDKLMPIVDGEILPKTNARLESFVAAGVKAEKKKVEAANKED
jgi:hypothetical protein